MYFQGVAAVAPSWVFTSITAGRDSAIAFDTAISSSWGVRTV